MKQWKQRSSVRLKRFIRLSLAKYARKINVAEPVWQRRYYDFRIYSEKKAREKLKYMHMNPVRAGLVGNPCDWLSSSAQFYEMEKPVGVPITWPL